MPDAQHGGSDELSFRQALKHIGQSAHAESNEAFKKTLEYEVPELDLQELINALVAWYEAQSLECEVLELAGGTLVQCRRTGTLRKYFGMNSELTVLIKPAYPRLIVEVGAGKWAAKVGAGAAGTVGALLFPWVFVPYLGGVVFGTWQQQQLRQRTIEIVEEVVRRYRHAGEEIP